LGSTLNIPISLQISTRKEYRRIIESGYSSTGGSVLARPPGSKGKCGRIKKAAYRNLLESIDRFEDEVLCFMTNADVPFTNNTAERPVRMVKVHMKISGYFRSQEQA
jgi:transposase